MADDAIPSQGLSTAAMRFGFMPHTEAYAQMFLKGDERDRAVLREMHLFYEAEMRRIVADPANEPHNIAHTINLEVDRSVEHTLKTKNGRKVQCRRGCGSCCTLHVSITREEAALLLIAAEDKGVTIDRAKLERQAEHDLTTWGQQSPGQRRCIFLTRSNDCAVYEHRPSACRKYLVASEPRKCDTVKFPGGRVAFVVPAEGEAIVSAMLGVLSWGTMARMLLAALDERDQQIAAEQPQGLERAP